MPCPFITGSIDPDEAILLVHFIGGVTPQPALGIAGHLGDARWYRRDGPY